MKDILKYNVFDEVEMVKENPNLINLPNKELYYKQSNAYAFGYTNGELLISQGGGMHRDMGLFRSEFTFAGRFWVEDKIISFWEYPSKSEMPKILEDIKKTFMDKYKKMLNFNDWRIEINISNFNTEEWKQTDVVGKLIPINDYVSSVEHSKEDLAKKHIQSPLKKSSSSVSHTIGSKRYLHKKPLKYRQSLYSEHKVFEEVEMVGSDFDITSIKPYKTDKEIEYEYIKELGKKGELLNYLKEGNELTFGLLRALFNDAVLYKKKREYTKGIYKFFHRAIPIAFATIWFPLWLVGQILGGTRSINKVLLPVLKMNHGNYTGFLVKLVITTMKIMEGEIKIVMGDDWFYKVFLIDKGLLKLVRKEYLIDFASEIADIMEIERDDKIVPKYYINNEFIDYLNDRFNLKPKLQKLTDKNEN